MWRTGFVATVLLASTSAVFGCGYGYEYGDGDGKLSREAAIKQQRQQGPAGLERALAAYDSLCMGAKLVGSEELERCREEVDLIAGQRHATISRLYWYTDLEKAKAAAQQSRKPILSLRMLGKLTDEFSCANSRFFRTSLYANEAISKQLREQFVLHWQSVRPVPKVTIDFGDGRTLQRTVTGNSAHYVLDPTGRPLEVLPGLYSPKEFQAWLDRAIGLAKECQEITAEGDLLERKQIELLSKYHRNRHQQIVANWTNDIKQVAPQLLTRNGYDGASGGGYGGGFGGGFGGEYGGYGEVGIQSKSDSRGLINVSAIKASTRAKSKARPELPILEAIRMSPQETDDLVTDKLWQRLASLHRSDVKLDKQTVSLMRQQNPTALQAGAWAVAKRAAEDPIVQVVRQFEGSISLDTVRNEYLLHRQIHKWFSQLPVPNDFEQLNERVYTELFLTPSSDPWLGLVPEDAYTALENGGLSQPQTGKLLYGQQN